MPRESANTNIESNFKENQKNISNETKNLKKDSKDSTNFIESKTQHSIKDSKKFTESNSQNLTQDSKEKIIESNLQDSKNSIESSAQNLTKDSKNSNQHSLDFKNTDSNKTPLQRANVNIESNFKDSNKLQNLDSKNIDSKTQNLRKDSKNFIESKTQDSIKNSKEKITESNLQNSTKDSKKFIESNSQNLTKDSKIFTESNLQDSIKDSNKSQNLDSKTQDSKAKITQSTKFQNYKIYNFTHPNNQNKITFIMPSDKNPPLTFTYKTHFKLSFLYKLLQYYITGILGFIFALFLYKNLSVKSKIDSKKITQNALFLSLISTIFCVALLYNGHNWGGDFSQYIAQARAVTQGSEGIKAQIANNTFMIQNSDAVLGAYIYPWGFCLLLVPIIALFGLNLIALKCVGVASFSVFIFIFHIFISRSVSQHFAIIATLLFALNPLFLDFTNNILSDIPFMLFNFVAVIMLSNLFKTQDLTHKTPTFFYILSASLLATFAYFIRNNGIVIMLSFLAMQLILITKKRSINIESSASLSLHILPFIIFIALNFMLTKWLGSGGEGHFEFMLKSLSVDSVLSNLQFYLTLFKDFFGMPRDIVNTFGLVMYFLGVICAFVGFQKSKNYFFLCVFFAHLLLLIVWPFTQGVRFIFALFPFLIFWAFVGLDSMNLKVKKIANILFSLVFIFYFYKGVEIFKQKSTRENHGAFEPYALQMYEFISQNLSKDSKIIFTKPRVLYLTSAHLGFYTTDLSRLKQADFILISAEMPLLESSTINSLLKNGEITQVYENKNFALYKIAK